MPLEYGRRPREYGEDVRRRKWNVKEEAHFAAPTQLTQLFAHVEQVVVVDQHQVVLPQHGEERFGEAAVDAAVGAVGVVAYDHVLGEAVQQRPQGAVGEAGVEEADVVVRKIDRRELDVAEAGNVRARLPLALRTSAAPAEPQPARLLHSGPHGANQSADRHGAALFGGHLRRGWDAIGDDDQPGIVRHIARPNAD